MTVTTSYDSQPFRLRSDCARSFSGSGTDRALCAAGVEASPEAGDATAIAIRNKATFMNIRFMISPLSDMSECVDDLHA